MLANKTSKWSGLCSDRDSFGSWMKPIALKMVAKAKTVTWVPVHSQKRSGRNSTLSYRNIYKYRINIWFWLKQFKWMSVMMNCRLTFMTKKIMRTMIPATSESKPRKRPLLAPWQSTRQWPLGRCGSSVLLISSGTEVSCLCSRLWKTPFFLSWPTERHMM